MKAAVCETPEEAALVARLRAGDESAFEVVLRLYAGRCLRLARRMLSSEEDARDAVQDAFLAAFRSIGSFEENAHVSTWLHRIVVNCCLMRLRSKRRHPEEWIEDLLPEFKEDGHHLLPIAEWRDLPDEALSRAETGHQVRECIDRLPDAYRNVLLLRDIEEMSTEETAALLGVTRAAVKLRLHRARLALRTMLDGNMQRGT